MSNFSLKPEFAQIKINDIDINLSNRIRNSNFFILIKRNIF